MEKLSAMMVQEAVVLDLKAQEKVGVIKELAQLLIARDLITDPDEFYTLISTAWTASPASTSS
jgi:mannitol/fructose-specific phosphotransferase system IIA component (Ntr-type)